MNEYDVLIVANSPGGWVASISLAQSGRKVALLDGVGVVPVTMIPRGGVFLQAFPLLEQRIKLEDSLFQFVTPGHRFSVPRNFNRFLSELGIEFPEHRDELEPILARVQDAGRTVSDYLRIWGIETKRPDHRTLDGKLFEKLSLWRHYQRVRHLNSNNLDQGLSRSRSLCRILESPARFSSGVFWPGEEEGMGAFSAYFRQAFFPLFSLSEPKAGLVGLGEVMTFLRRIAREMKIEVLNPGGAPLLPGEKPDGAAEETPRFRFTSARQIRKNAGFHLWDKKGEEKPVSFRSLIWSGNGRGFIKSIPEPLSKSRPAKMLSRHLEALKVRYQLGLLEIRIQAAVIPVGMEKRVFLINDPAQDLADENLIYLEVIPVPEFESGAGEPRAPREKGDLMIQAAFLRSASKSAEEVAGRVLRQIGGLIPFLKEFLVGDPVLKNGDEFFAGGLPVWQNRREHHRGKLTAPLGKAGIFYSGRELFPALGSEADLLSGLVTAWSAEKWLRKISK